MLDSKEILTERSK